MKQYIELFFVLLVPCSLVAVIYYFVNQLIDKIFLISKVNKLLKKSNYKELQEFLLKNPEIQTKYKNMILLRMAELANIQY